MDDRIVQWAPYGEHIPLRCRQCGTTGTTKNIGYIGARTIFVPCSCSILELEPIEPPDVKERLEADDAKNLIHDEFEQFMHDQGAVSLKDMVQKLKDEGDYSFDRVKFELNEQRKRLWKMFRETRMLELGIEAKYLPQD